MTQNIFGIQLVALPWQCLSWEKPREMFTITGKQVTSCDKPADISQVFTLLVENSCMCSELLIEITWIRLNKRMGTLYINKRRPPSWIDWTGVYFPVVGRLSCSISQPATTITLFIKQSTTHRSASCQWWSAKHLVVLCNFSNCGLFLFCISNSSAEVHTSVWSSWSPQEHRCWHMHSASPLFYRKMG